MKKKNAKIQLIPILFCISLLALSGCAHRLTQEECENNSLYHMGLADGNNGKSLNLFTQYQSQCEKFNIELDQVAYQKGWRQGNQSYCQAPTAFSLGKTGKPYPIICTDDNVHELRAEYNRGLQVYQRIQLVNRQIAAIKEESDKPAHIKAEMSSIQDRINSVHDDLDRAKSHAYSESTISHYKHEIRDLKSRMELLKAELITATALDIARHSENEQRKAELYQELDRLNASR